MSIRVLHVVESLSTEAGSVVVCLRGMFTALKQRGVESSVQAEKATVSTSAAPDAVVVDEPPTKAALASFDLVCLHGWEYPLARRIARLSRSAGQPYLIAPHGTLNPGPFKRDSWMRRLRRTLFDTRVIRRAAALLALNEAEERGLRRQFPPSRIVRLPYGLDFESYSAEPQALHQDELPDGPFLLKLGSLEPVDGGVALLKSAAELGRDADGWSIVLAGPDRGSWRPMLEAAVHRKGGQGRVVFTSADGLASQRALLHAAAVVVAPSLHTRPPVSIMQAAASGKAAVATDCTVPDELRDAVSVCRTNRADLRNVLRSMLTMTDTERDAMGEQARAAGRRSLDWDNLIDRHLEIYRELV